MVRIFAYLLLHIVKQYVFETIQLNCQQYPCNFPIPLFVFNTIQASVALFMQRILWLNYIMFLQFLFTKKIQNCIWLNSVKISSKELTEC